MRPRKATPRRDAGAGELCTGGPSTDDFAHCGPPQDDTATASSTSRSGARKSFIGLLIAAATVAVALLIPAVANADNPTYFAGRADYAPEQVVDLHGQWYSANTSYSFPVNRPDRIILIVDPPPHIPTPRS